MNDRFKFRLIVDKDTKTINGTFKGQYIYYCNGFIQGKTKTTFYGNGKKYTFLNSQVKKIDQCTGLKDMNGKLIYEGDIVKSKDGFILKVTYRNDYACFCVENEEIVGYFQILHWTPTDFNIIGNIYENKELLGEQNEI